MKVFDTFLFDGELELLSHRLTELFDLVDYFVIVEARRTYRGEPKELTFARCRASFAWAESKLRTVALNSLGSPDSTPRQRAALQRNMLTLALHDALPEDIVLICDADEIPSREVLTHLRNSGLPAPHRMAMTRHYEFLDVIAPRSPCCPTAGDPFAFATDVFCQPRWDRLDSMWYGRSAVAVRHQDLRAGSVTARSPYDWRFGAGELPVLENAGRHFSSTDPAARLETKLGRVFHAEFADETGLSLVHLNRCRRYGIHHRGWWYAARPSGSLPEDLLRLAQRQPDLRRTKPFPPMPFRRMVRSWAWVRLEARLPRPLVRFVDRHFESLLPLLAAPLLVADLLRGLYAKWLKRWPTRLPLETVCAHQQLKNVSNH